jgi:hypothetical protein
MVIYELKTERQERAGAEDRAWLKGAATPSALALKLNNMVHTTLSDFLEPNAADDAMVMRPMSMIEPKAFDALKAVEITERVLQGEEGDRRIIERKYKITLHEPMKAAQMLRELFGMDAMEIFKAEAEASQGAKKSNGLELIMTPREFERSLEYVAPQYRTEADWEKELLG